MTELNKLIDPKKSYPVAEAIVLAKQTSKTKFDANIELHARLGIDVKKGDQQVRASLTYPKSIGKKRVIVAFVPQAMEKEAKAAGADIVGGEELIKQIIQSKKTDFDTAIATPDMMKLLAPAARILGPRGLMPSPKNGTVTPHVKEAIEEFKKGKIDFKNDGGGNVHLVLGKASFSDTDLAANFSAALEAIRKAKPSSSKGVYLKNVSLSSGMGPGIKVEV
jgi:large subunit ribosomal protein L1